MISFKSLNISINNSSIFPFKRLAVKKHFYWFCAFCILVATLEFAQDYIGSLLNGDPFQFFRSFSYMAFWLLFIPFSIFTGYGLDKAGANFSGAIYIICNIIFILIITLIHLVAFSIFLFGLSHLFQTDPWQLSMLITEKLSTRLYIALSIYIVLSAIYFLNKRRETGQQEYSKTITVKNGQTSVIVNIKDIKWISSDGHYLNIHTSDKKYVVVDSLKNIITTLPDNFKRIHRSTIVNIDMVSELKSRLNGDYDLILNDGNILRLSRNFTDSVKGVLL